MMAMSLFRLGNRGTADDTVGSVNWPAGRMDRNRSLYRPLASGGYPGLKGSRDHLKQARPPTSAPLPTRPRQQFLSLS